MTFDRAQLVAAAEVDPWALLAQLKAGDPAEIERLAAAFYRASGEVRATSKSLTEAAELIGDGVSTIPGQPTAQIDATKDLVTGHPLDAGNDLVNGTVKQGKYLLHTGEDLVESGEDVIDAGKAWLSDRL